MYVPGIIEIILFVYLIIKVRSLQNQVNEVSRGDSVSKTAINNLETNSPTVKDSAGGISSQSTRTGSQSENVTLEEKEQHLVIEWLKENWILKLGIFLILAGFGWFVSYAFVHNWIGPIGRITLGFVLGAVVTAFGDIRMKKSKNEGGSFMVLGASIILITITAARFVYGFFNPIIALGFVFLTASYVTMSAMRYDTKSLALSGLILASIAPILVDFNRPDLVVLFLYISVVSIASIWVMFNKNWREIGAAASVMVLLYSLFLGMFGNVGSSEYTLLNISYLLSLIFLVSNISVVNKFKDGMNGADALLAIVNGILIMLWTMSHAPEVWQSLILAMWMVIVAIGSFFVFFKTKEIKFFYIYSMVAIVYLATATAIELDGNALIFAYIFESAVISLAGYAITAKPEIGHRLSLLMVPPAIMTLVSFGSSSWRSSVFNQDFAIILSMAIVLIGIGYFYYLIKKGESEDYVSGLEMNPPAIMIIAGTYYLFGLIWVSLDAAYTSALAVLLSLAIYTIVGITSYFFGKSNNRKVYTTYGAVLLIGVVARLLLIDVWDMDLALRIVTFIVIGILFVSTAFLTKKDEGIKEVKKVSGDDITTNEN